MGPPDRLLQPLWSGFRNVVGVNGRNMFVFLQVYLTSSEKVMGKNKNQTSTQCILYALGGIVSVLNVMLLVSLF